MMDHKGKNMIVDDDHDTLFLLKTTLEKEGHTVTTYSRAPNARALSLGMRLSCFDINTLKMSSGLVVSHSLAVWTFI